MLEKILYFDSSVWMVLFVVTLLTSLLWYYWFIFIPYANFPSLRLEHRIPYWVLTGQHLNSVLFQTSVDYSKKYEADGVLVLWLGLPYLVVYGEEMVKAIVSEPSAINKPKVYEFFEFAIGKGLLTSNGEEWKRQRKLLAPAFHTASVRSFTSVFNKHSESLVEELLELKGQPTNEFFNILSKHLINIIFETGLNSREISDKEDHAGEDSSRFVKAIKMVDDFFIYRIWSPWLYFDFTLRLFPCARAAFRCAEELKRNIVGPILEKQKRRMNLAIVGKAGLQSPDSSEADSEHCGRKLKSFGEILLEQHLKNPSFSMDELTTQILILVAGGYDTTAQTVMWCLFLLGLHQDVQERAYEEVMSEAEGNIQFEDVPNSLTYLECVIKETLRLYPVPLFARLLQKDLQCGKYLIPKNTAVGVFSYMLHRNPDIYPDPEKFDPERFLEKNSKIKPWNYVPFAEGVRSCIGKKYAMIGMKCILAHLLRRFKIYSLDRKEDVEVKWAIVLESTKELRMQFAPR